MPCYVFYPVFKAEGGVENHVVRENQLNAQRLGATLIPMPAGRASMLWYQSRKILAERTDGTGIMLPAGLKLRESAVGTSEEVVNHTPQNLRAGTWVSAISSGTTAAGVILGLREWQHNIHFLCYFGSHKNEDKTREYMIEIAGYEPDNLRYVDEGWDYSAAEERPVPFPCSKFYEAKAWHWMLENIEELETPIVFWSIGD
jgi:1-aminocyclopropane-1-carboxylate deaminase/D-cysteine desulfhydrase-like pyridoxal-dependent ACC family enzyme